MTAVACNIFLVTLPRVSRDTLRPVPEGSNCLLLSHCGANISTKAVRNISNVASNVCPKTSALRKDTPGVVFIIRVAICEVCPEHQATAGLSWRRGCRPWTEILP